jgi:predicted MPP superfamily phosphohydrolase
MSSTCVFGDLHGRTHWQKEVKNDLYDMNVFLGDYVDHWTYSDETIIDNLNALINYKKKNKDKVILLLGNHDLMYMFLGESQFKCSGFRSSYAVQLNQIFRENRHLFQASYQYGDTLLTHAGLSKKFFNVLKERLSDKIKLEGEKYSEYLNEVFRNVPNYLSDVSHYRGGLKEHGGIFWADMKEHLSKNNHIKGLNQIVGHQPVPSITTIPFGEDTFTWADVGSHDCGDGNDIYRVSL